MMFKEHNPKTLEEAIDAVVSQLKQEEIDYIKKEGAKTTHFTFGMAMRNGWGLWSDSDLAQHFKSRFGLGHADDMSALILSGVDAKVRGERFDVDKEAEYYKKYWLNMNIDPLTLRINKLMSKDNK